MFWALDDIWEGKFSVEEMKMDEKGKKYLEKENIFANEKKKGEKVTYLGKENVSSAEEKENREGKGGNILEKEN